MQLVSDGCIAQAKASKAKTLTQQEMFQNRTHLQQLHLVLQACNVPLVGAALRLAQPQLGSKRLAVLDLVSHLSLRTCAGEAWHQAYRYLTGACKLCLGAWQASRARAGPAVRTELQSWKQSMQSCSSSLATAFAPACRSSQPGTCMAALAPMVLASIGRTHLGENELVCNLGPRPPVQHGLELPAQGLLVGQGCILGSHILQQGQEAFLQRLHLVDQLVRGGVAALQLAPPAAQ